MNFNENRDNIVDVTPVREQGLTKFFNKVYGFMAAGLIISAVMSYLVLGVMFDTTARLLSNYPFLPLILMGIELVLVITITNSKNSNAALVKFILFSILNGLTMAITLSMYANGSIIQAFVATALVFIVMTAYGMLTKRDLVGMQGVLFVILVGGIILSLLNVFIFQSSPLDILVSAVFLVIFAVLISSDHQLLRQMYFQATQNNISDDNITSIAVYGALTLYLDVINVFLSILRLFGDER